MIPGLLIVVAALFGGVLLVSEKARILVKGAGNLFLEDMTKTEKGAQIVYTQAIEEAQDRYNKSSDDLSELSGRMIEMKCDYDKYMKELEQVESQCEKLAAINDLESLKIKALQRKSLLDKVHILEENVRQLVPMVDAAKEGHQYWELELNRLRQDKENVLLELKTSKTIKEMNDRMDANKRTTATSKLLGNVKDNVKDAKRAAVGSQYVQQNKIETKSNAVDKLLQDSEQDEYIQLLLEKHKK